MHIADRLLRDGRCAGDNDGLKYTWNEARTMSSTPISPKLGWTWSKRIRGISSCMPKLRELANSDFTQLDRRSLEH